MFRRNECAVFCKSCSPFGTWYDYGNTINIHSRAQKGVLGFERTFVAKVLHLVPPSSSEVDLGNVKERNVAKLETQDRGLESLISSEEGCKVWWLSAPWYMLEWDVKVWGLGRRLPFHMAHLHRATGWR